MSGESYFQLSDEMVEFGKKPVILVSFSEEKTGSSPLAKFIFDLIFVQMEF